MRDAADTCIAVCSMENVDPLGVHTGDSAVVAPVQTLPDPVHQRLRTAALDIIRALGVEGGCNVQFALSPDSSEYAVIEVNPRVSRSSALASKATGYPIARVAAQIAVGRRLDEIPNAITGTTVAAFEPALDYVVVKLPRFPFDKFPGADRTLGSQMKATGEVMAIERTFGAALNKALRGLEQAGAGFLAEDPAWGRHARRARRLGRRRSRWRARAHPGTDAEPRSDLRRRAHGRGRARGGRRRAEAVPASRPDAADALPAAIGLPPVASARAAAPRRAGSRAAARHGHGAVVPLRDGAPRRHRASPAGRGRSPRRRDAGAGQARLLQRPRHRCAQRDRSARDHRPATGHGPASGLCHGGHLRGRVRRRDAVLLRHLRCRRLGAGGAPGQATGRAGHRLRPRAHRTGHRVRLLRGPGRPDAAARTALRR